MYKASSAPVWFRFSSRQTLLFFCTPLHGGVAPFLARQLGNRRDPTEFGRWRSPKQAGLCGFEPNPLIEQVNHGNEKGWVNLASRSCGWSGWAWSLLPPTRALPKKPLNRTEPNWTVEPNRVNWTRQIWFVNGSVFCGEDVRLITS